MSEDRNPHREDNSIIAGRNAVLEALHADVELDKLFVADRQQAGSINKIVALARQRGVVVKQVSDQKLSALCGSENHQGGVHAGTVDTEPGLRHKSSVQSMTSRNGAYGHLEGHDVVCGM